MCLTQAEVYNKWFLVLKGVAARLAQIWPSEWKHIEPICAARRNEKRVSLTGVNVDHEATHWQQPKVTLTLSRLDLFIWWLGTLVTWPNLKERPSKLPTGLFRSFLIKYLTLKLNDAMKRDQQSLVGWSHVRCYSLNFKHMLYTQRGSFTLIWGEITTRTAVISLFEEEVHFELVICA